MTPSAVGTLADTPLAHALVYARNRRLTGRLELTAPGDRQATISIWRGRILAVETTPIGMCPGGFFGAIAYELGLIDAATLDATLFEIAETRRLHGEVLIERGAITPVQRDEVLVEQVHRKVHHLFSLPDATTYAFYDARFGCAEPPIAIDSLGPVWRGIRDHPPARFVAETVRRVGDHPLRAIAGSAARLPPAETALLEALGARAMPLGEMKRATELPPARVDLLVYLLVIAKCVEAVTGARTLPSTGALPVGMPSGPVPVSGEVRRVSAPAMATAHAPSLKTPVELGAGGIAEHARAVEQLGLFEVLGLRRGASAEAVRAAYMRLAKHWHPDRLPPELEEAKTNAARVFAQLSVAQRTLCDPPSRRAYLDAESAKRAARPRPIVLRAIEASIARRDFLSATQLCQALLDEDAEDAEALALHAWATVSAGEAADEAVGIALTQLDRAVNMDRTCDAAVYHRGLAHKRLGNVPAAFRDFARAVQLNPKNIDAEREVRLFAMRVRKGSSEHRIASPLLDKAAKKR